MMSLEFDIRPDEEGMVDGLQLGALLIAYAARMINPYVAKCPACLDTVFSHIANAELEKLHQAMKDPANDQQVAWLYCTATDNRVTVIRRALEAASPRIRAILEKEGQRHIH